MAASFSSDNLRLIAFRRITSWRAQSVKVSISDTGCPVTGGGCLTDGEINLALLGHSRCVWRLLRCGLNPAIDGEQLKFEGGLVGSAAQICDGVVLRKVPARYWRY